MNVFFATSCLTLMLSAPVPDDYPSQEWQRAEPHSVELDGALLESAREYALTGGGSGYIVRHGRLVMSWGDLRRRYDLKSTTKSIGVTALGLAIADGKIKLNDTARKHHPKLGEPPSSNSKTGWLEEITILHLATQSAGFEKPGGYGKLLFRPGTRWSYSDGGPNWLAECVTLKYNRDLDELLFERVFTPLGITRDDLRWRNNSYRSKTIDGVARREFGSGISANVDAMARIGYLYLRRGRWDKKQIIPESFVDAARQPVSSVVGLPEQDAKRSGNASDHYGLLWWNNADGTIDGLPRDAYWSWGLYDSLIVVIPSLDIVVARAGKSWKRSWSGHYDVLEPFLQPIARAARKAAGNKKPNDDEAKQSGGTGPSLRSYPGTHVRSPTVGRKSARYVTAHRKPRIVGIEWAAATTIRRAAEGSDNWPITWCEDGALFTAYGDGWGFKPRVRGKLSLGFARVRGGPQDFVGTNVRAETAEQLGDGSKGKKASGLLMVDGVLYMLVRNANNSQLAWSRDGGRTWSWSDWRLVSGMGCPTFVNFGRNYGGARDDYVYIVSPDSDSAYKPADRMVLARAKKDRITKRDAYEFFSHRDREGRPHWSKEFAQRGAVLQRPGRCYRGGVSYNAGLARYLWAQLPGGDTRQKGGLSIYEAAEPWGPWTAIFQTERWDVGPGESASFPTKWMSADGRTVYLVFSGNDSFSVRRATLVLESDP